MKNWSIRTRVLFLALAPSVMILLALITYFTYTSIAEVDISLERHGISVARQLAPGTEFALFAGDRAALQRLTDAAVHESDVARVTITDAHGQALAQSGQDERLKIGESVLFTQAVTESRLPAADFPEQMHVTTAPAKIREITVAMSRSAAHAEQRRLLLIGLALGLACLLVAVALAFVIGNSVIRPIQQLANAMVALGRGRRGVPLVTSGGGEIRTLQEGFNEMSARLHAFTQELETRVDVATRELVAQKDTAEQATSAKSRFIAAASHDLRQPLHAIGLFTATLERRAKGTDLEVVVRDLAQAVAVMDRLFDSLLDISRLDAGTLRPESKPFRLQHLFGQLAAEYFDAAQQKNLRLHIRPTTAVVVCDELLLHRLLGNLVANAIRYTNEGVVMICARRRGAAVQLEVRDSGIGIARDKQDEIFLEFYQIGNVARDRSLGLGLGLAIVSRLARLLATEVKVRSALGRGSVFFLRVPSASDDDVPTIVTQATDVSAQSEPTSLPVLVVDDDPLVLAGNRALLEELGCAVTTVSDGPGAEAALIAYRDKPVLVLCDLWLSDERSGIDLLQRLTTLTSAPISGILISGDTRPETIQAAKRAGYPLLHKPVSPARLRAVLTSFAWKMRRTTGSNLRDEDPSR